MLIAALAGLVGQDGLVGLAGMFNLAGLMGLAGWLEYVSCPAGMVWIVGVVGLLLVRNITCNERERILQGNFPLPGAWSAG
jgi:hypothetical protein